MKKIGYFLIVSMCAYWITGCATTQAPASNGNSSNAAANTNANAAKPVAAAPTADSLLANETKAGEAYLKHDTKFFEDFLNDKFAFMTPVGFSDRAGSLKDIAEHKCTAKDGIKNSEPQLRTITPDVAVMVYKSDADVTCDMGGKSEKMPPSMRAVSYYVRKGDKWLGAFHGETPIMDPKAPPPPPTKAEPKKDAKAAPAPPKPAADEMTAKLEAVEKAGWDAWKARDAKKLEEITTANVSIIDPMGGWFGTKADVIKAWTAEKCDIKSVGLSDASSMSLTPDVAVLNFKGTADGTCSGNKVGSIWGSSVYVKEGDTWKLAFSTSMLPM
jgi:ketosteroid isomerase-like protein